MLAGNLPCASVSLLVFAVGCSASGTNAASEAWPEQWTANIAWSTFDAAGSKTNTWTGKVSYDWTLRAMRTEIAPAPGADTQQDGGFGPPISGAGSMLMRDGKLYTIPIDGDCDVVSGIGAPTPDWLMTATSTASSAPGTERLLVNLQQLEPGGAGCFSYVRGAQDHVPRLFGGGPSCASLPAGSFIEYSDFAEQPRAPDTFTPPPSCLTKDTPPSTLCQRCHAH